jgi:hypothetical protein
MNFAEEEGIRFRASMEDAPREKLLADVRFLLLEIDRLRAVGVGPLTIRDHFAMAALAVCDHKTGDPAREAYAIADDMLKVRGG